VAFVEESMGGMDAHEMKRIDNAVRDAINAGDLDAFDTLLAPELAAEAREAVARIKVAFPDYAGDNEIQILEGDRVATRWVFTGTHTGTYRGIAPTGTRVTFTGLSMSRFADGRMVEAIIESDEESVLRQLGQSTLPDED
jgi:predicted ester cyclase